MRHLLDAGDLSRDEAAAAADVPRHTASRDGRGGNPAGVVLDAAGLDTAPVLGASLVSLAYQPRSPKAANIAHAPGVGRRRIEVGLMSGDRRDGSDRLDGAHATSSTRSQGGPSTFMTWGAKAGDSASTRRAGPDETTSPSASRW